MPSLRAVPTRLHARPAQCQTFTAADVQTGTATLAHPIERLFEHNALGSEGGCKQVVSQPMDTYLVAIMNDLAGGVICRRRFREPGRWDARAALARCCAHLCTACSSQPQHGELESQ